jgi:hypothetical protein
MVVLDASVGDEMQILGLSHTVTCRFWEERWCCFSLVIVCANKMTVDNGLWYLSILLLGSQSSTALSGSFPCI